MILYNPKDSVVEFFYGGKLQIFQPKESRLVDELLANHALKTTNTGLVEYMPSIHDKDMVLSDIPYKDMPWRKLVSLASARKVHKPGMNRYQVEEAMGKYDERQKAGTL